MASMLGVMDTVSFLVYLWLGLHMANRWRRNPDRISAAVALAVGSISLSIVLVRIHAMTGGGHRALLLATALLLLSSGYALVHLRHAFVAVSRRIRTMAAVALASVGSLIIISYLVPSLMQRLGPLESIIRITFAVSWMACAIEPIGRFFWLARLLPPVQRARLRSIAGAYAGLLVLLVIGVLSPTRGGELRTLLLEIVLIALAPMMAVGFDPPRWLRRIWRADVETSLQHAIDGLFELRDRRHLAEHALAWSCRLVGAERAMCEVDGEVLAVRGLEQHRVARLMWIDEFNSAAKVDPDTHAIVQPLKAGDLRGKIVVVSGPFTPAFGSEEIEALRRFGGSFAAALEHATMFQRLQEQTQRAEVLLQAQSDLGEGVVVVQDLKIVHANEAYCQMSGYSLAELKSMPSVLDLAGDEERAVHEDRHRRRLAGESVPSHFETLMYPRDGHPIDIEIATKELRANGQLQTVTIVRDVTQRKSVERQLRAQRAQLTQAQELARMGSWEWDLRTEAGAFSDEMCKMLGVDAGTLADSAERLFQQVVPEDRRMIESLVLAAVQEQGSFDADVGLSQPDGSVRTLSVHGEVERSEEGEPVRIFGTGQDVTERKRAEDALRESERRYAAAYEHERKAVERLKAVDAMKDTFLNAVSHELRTPLTTVLGYAQTLESESHRLTEEQRASFAGRIATSALRLERLLSDLLDLDRLRRGIIEPRRRPMNLSVLIGRIVDGSEIALRRTVHMRSEDVVLDVDVAMVERVVENLLSNADRYTPSEGDIWVAVERQGEEAVIEVADAGPGVPVEMRDEIFEPFRQGENSMTHSPGVGIGLALVSRFAEAHGGRVEVSERRGGGAVFRVYLPGGAAQAQSGLVMEQSRRAQRHAS